MISAMSFPSSEYSQWITTVFVFIERLLWSMVCRKPGRIVPECVIFLAERQPGGAIMPSLLPVTGGFTLPTPTLADVHDMHNPAANHSDSVDTAHCNFRHFGVLYLYYARKKIGTCKFE